MNKNRPLLFLLLSSLTLVCCTQKKASGGITPVSEASDNIGKVITIRTKVTGHHKSKGKGPHLLNMGGSYPNHKLTLVFWDSDLEKNFPSGFAPSDLVTTEVTATGAITTYKEKPQMVIKKPEQIGLKKKVATPTVTKTPTTKRFTDASGNITLYYNSPIGKKPSNDATSPIGKSLISLINSSQRTLDIAAYGFRNQNDVYTALKQAKQRGVKIRLVIDRDVNGDNYYTSTEKFVDLVENVKDDRSQDLRTSRMQTKSFSPYWAKPDGFKGYAQPLGYSLDNKKAIIAVHASREAFDSEGDIMHHKFVVADGSKVWTGSCNISNSGTGGYNANIGCIINSRPVARHYTGEFNRLYEQGLFHRAKNEGHQPSPRNFNLNGSTVSIGFSPQDYTVRNMVAPLIKNATKSIDVAVFYLTHKYLTADLIKAHQRGIKVRVIIDATSAMNGYTQHRLLRAAGIPVKVENWGGKMHMKTCCVDNQYIVLGSMNWTSAGERKNDENVLVLDSKKEARKYTNFFNSLWYAIPEKCLTADPDPESLASLGSTSDGIDNDYDKLIDADDPNALKEVYDTAKLPPFGYADLTSGTGTIKGKKHYLICGVNRNGYKYYILPNDERYDRERSRATQFFPSIWEAKDAGYAPPSR